MNLLEALEKLNPFSRQNERATDKYSTFQKEDHQDDDVYARLERQDQYAQERKYDLLLSKSLFGHYLAGSGKPVDVPEEELKSFSTIAKAEMKNQDRLINSLPTTDKLFKKVGNGLSPVKWGDIKENDRVVLDDYFDADTSGDDAEANGDSDLHYGLGHYKLRSKSNLEFVKTNGKLLPYGTVTHSVQDRYDFNPDTTPGKVAPFLEKPRIAKTFDVKSQWQSRPYGVINLKDDKPDASELIWEPQ